MSKRKPKPKKTAPVVKSPDLSAALRQALSKRTKAELVDVVLDLAQDDRGILRQLAAQFDVTPARVRPARRLARPPGDPRPHGPLLRRGEPRFGLSPLD